MSYYLKLFASLSTGDKLYYKFLMELYHTSANNQTIELHRNDKSAVYENSAGFKGVLTYGKNTGAVYGTFELGDRSRV